ncbi:hypothetical protein CERZMDRAFT_99916 [Cercospora zeae-maydis SCOH1-5]|uniref:Thioesterase domain-containing protein n=1 Tax=Cercospora zeae-maydis SCOH1-5 TaxID=717836 RepID=A0A6A6F8Y8_9PEZI|nr:hypothetical protein CERZMDRAFT_99916 [Cercospora zeae-maydis SCOH1-5]
MAPNKEARGGGTLVAAQQFRSARLASELPGENLGDFDDLEWAQAIIRDPAWEEIPFASRTIARNSTMQSLFSRTFATLDTLRACQAFTKSRDTNSKEASGASDYMKNEIIVIISLGRGLDGHPGLAHGGTIAALFDECLGLGAVRTLTRPSMTGQLTIKYKAPVPTPSVVLVRCSASKHEGRKAWISGTIEDGMGTVYAEGEALFIMQREKL